MRSFTAILLFAVSGLLAWYALMPASSPTDTPNRQNGRLAETPYAHRNWDDARGPSESKISAFTFQDRNRNGQYDPDDLPMAGVAVRVERPDGQAHTRTSNINGFVNFTMAPEGPAADITQVDAPHRFRVAVPPGFSITTNNVEQTTTFRYLKGSIANIYAEDPPRTVGLAPVLTVSGRFEPTSDGFPAARVIDPTGTSIEIAIHADGRFTFPASPGVWRIRADTGLEREFSVADSPVVLAQIRPASAIPPPGLNGFVEDFEWLHRAVIEKIANGHLGLDWDYLLAVDNQYYGGPGYVNTLRSGRVVGYNSSGHPVTVSARNGERFDFEGAYFGIAWPNAEGEILHVEAWRDGRMIGQEQFALSYLAPIWFDAAWRDIDRLQFRTEHYWQFVTDDMRFSLR